LNLWAHQREAVDFARDRAGTVLDMGMGTGKTCTALQLLQDWDARRVLVVCPVEVTKVWPQLIARHCDEPDRWAPVALSGMSTAKRLDVARSRLRYAELAGQRYVACINYDVICRDRVADWLLDQRWDAVVLDESHRIKAPDGKQSNVAREVAHRAPRRLAMTGTLMPNGPLDAWAQLDAVDPSVLGPSYRLFTARYTVEAEGVSKRPVVPAGAAAAAEIEALRVRAGVPDLGKWLTKALWGGGTLDACAQTCGTRRFRLYQLLPHLGLRVFKRTDALRDLDDLRARIASASYRCESDEVLVDLPPATQVTRTCALTGKAREAYDQMEAELYVEIGGGQVTAANGAVKLMRLSQIASGYLPLDGEAQVIHAAKNDLLRSVLGDLQPPTPWARGEAVVIFARYHPELDSIHAACKATGHEVRELSGRRRQLDEWQGGAGNVLAAQIQAGSEGVDMTRARVAIYWGPVWHGQREQSERRVRRPGQDRPVLYVDLVVEDTVEQDIIEAQQAKADVVSYCLRRIQERSEKR